MFVLLGSTLFTITWVLHALHRVDRQLQNDFNHDRELERFVTQLRLDAHQAKEATLGIGMDGVAGMLRLNRPDGVSIEYGLTDDGIERLVYQNDLIEHHETYRLHLAKNAVWQIDSSAGRTQVSLPVPWTRKDGDKQESITAVIRVVAAIGIVSPGK